MEGADGPPRWRRATVSTETAPHKQDAARSRYTENERRAISRLALAAPRHGTRYHEVPAAVSPSLVSRPRSPPRHAY